MALNILVVDDEEDIRNLISEILVDAKFEVRTAADSSKAFSLIEEKLPSAIILDVWLQEDNKLVDGLRILEIVKKKHPSVPVIVISGHGTISTAVSAIRMGAFDYIEKPFTQEKLLIVLKRACENAKLVKENIELKSQVVDKDEIIGESPFILKVRSDIVKLGSSASRVLLEGPVGSGKELIARLIHKNSKFAVGPFIVYNPTGLSSAQVNYDLFSEGLKNNIYNKDCTSHKSIFELANNGTLLIDEVINLPLSSQDKLLKFIQNPIIERQGKSYKVNVRIISSTTRDINQAVDQSKFNQDLYCRLSVVNIKVPPIFERKEDIPSLVEHYTKYLTRSSRLMYRRFSEDAMIVLQGYNWPGNIRQIKNVIEWCLIMNPFLDSESEVITVEMLPSNINSDKNIIYKPDSNSVDIMSMPLREAREVFERQYLAAQMNRFSNNISRTSSFVGMERSALHRKLKLLKIHSAGCGLQDEQSNGSILEEGLA